MNKDVIYIDVEDDITAIIGKVKAAKEKIVALVPPKRVGVLQSAVNLRLLARAAEQSGRRLVLITNNQALVALSGPAKIPVARNLQSKPELAQVVARDIDDDDEDIIDGAQLPVGELARMADPNAERVDPALDKAVDELDKNDTMTVLAPPPVAGQAPARAKTKKGPKVPNFSDFRKRLFLIIAGIVLLVGLLIWALVFAAHATVVITAKTMNATVNQKVTLDPNGPNVLSTSTVHAIAQQQKKQQTVKFDATGSKDVGETATGTVKFSTDSISALGKTIPAGTVLTSTSGLTYTTDQSVTMSISNSSGATTGVTAAGRGAKYNGAAGPVSGAPAGISATLVGSTAGGTDKTVKVVTKEDVQKAAEQLTAQKDDTIKTQLQAAFGKDAVVINESYAVIQAAPVATPTVDAEADGQATLTSEVTYTMLAIPRTDLSSFLNGTLTKQLEGLHDQKVYDDGSNKVSFANFAKVDAATTVQLMAVGKVGPKIDEQAIKQQARGKRYGDIQSQLQTIQGVSGVDVKFSPFWVSTAPNDANKISVEFKLSNGS